MHGQDTAAFYMQRGKERAEQLTEPDRVAEDLYAAIETAARQWGLTFKEMVEVINEVTFSEGG